jgi:predicted ATPase
MTERANYASGSEPSRLFPILYGQIVFHDGYADYRKAQRISEEFLRLAENESADGPALVARRMLGTCLFLRGEISAGRKNMEEALASYDPTRHGALTFQYGADQRSAGLAWLALALFLLGYPAQARRASHEAIVLAKDTGHAITQAHALRVGGCFLHVASRDKRDAQEQAAELEAFAVQQRLPYWRAEAQFISAWASVESMPTEDAISQMCRLLSDLAVPGMGADQPFLLALLADAYGHCQQFRKALDVIDEALSTIRNTDEFWWVADIYRLKGQMLLYLNVDNAPLGEACFEKAISIAQRQSARCGASTGCSRSSRVG